MTAAAPSLLAWFGQTNNAIGYQEDDAWCREGFRVVNQTAGPDTASLIAAREYLVGLVIKSLDLGEYLKTNKNTRNPESTARSMTVYDAIVLHLNTLNLPTDVISLEGAGECAGSSR